MISIIVSSYNANFYTQLVENIEKTIGDIPYEVIKIENPGLMGICEVYNKGAEKAIYPFLCFCHEDILFKTGNWGQVVIDIFTANSSLGLLGIAGSDYKTAIPSGWGFVAESRSANIIQHNKFHNWPVYHHYENPRNKSLANAVCIDGVWMCTTKVIALELKFDQKTFQSFHCYDIDFSLSVFRKYKVAVTFDVLLEHFSEGRNDSSWINNTITLHKKWRKVLPLALESIPEKKQREHETSAAIQFQNQMNEAGISFWKRLVFLSSSVFVKSVSAKEIINEIFRISLFTLKKTVKKICLQ